MGKFKKSFFISPLNNGIAWTASVPSWLSGKRQNCVHESCSEDTHGALSHTPRACLGLTKSLRPQEMTVDHSTLKETCADQFPGSEFSGADPKVSPPQDP